MMFRSDRKVDAVSIKAIETRYAGCRFRSRLEARWAVFFDTLGIAWEYEPQGFEIEWRLSLRPGTFRYLPDFWLPDHQLWVEVKGSLTIPECERVLNAAAYLSTNGGGGCHDDGGHDLVLAGPIPRVSEYFMTHIPYRLHMHKGYLYTTDWLDYYGDAGSSIGCDGTIVAADCGGSFWDIVALPESTQSLITDKLLEGYPVAPLFRLISAIEAARSARFEHGERG